MSACLAGLLHGIKAANDFRLAAIPALKVLLLDRVLPHYGKPPGN